MTAPRVRVCVTFDFDALSGWLFGVANPTPHALSRGEFGARVAAPRLLDLLARYGIPTTWFIPGHTADTFPEQVLAVAEAGHEIAHHGYLHEVPTRLGSREAERAVIERGIAALERITGGRVRGYRAPAWFPSEHTFPLLHELGFSYDSSLMWDDFRLSYLRLGDRPERESAYVFGQEVDLVEVPIAWELDDWQWFEYEAGWSEGMFPPSRVLQLWQSEFDFAYQHEPGAVYTLTMHPQVIGHGSRIVMLERLLRHIRSHPDVEFRTVEAVVAEYREQNPFEKRA